MEDLLSKYQKIFHKTAPKMLNSSWCLWFSCLCFCEPGRKWMEKGVLCLHCGFYFRVGIVGELDEAQHDYLLRLKYLGWGLMTKGNVNGN